MKRLLAQEKKLFIAAMLVLFAILPLSACEVEDPPTPVPTDAPVPTVTPAPTPESFASATPPPTDVPAPTATLLPYPTATPEMTEYSTPTPTPQPSPTPTATPEMPTATPEMPTATPEMTEYLTPTPIPQPGPNPTATPEMMENPTPTPISGQVDSRGLSGGEVMAMLTTDETDCIKQTFGVDLYNAVLELNITSSLASHPGTTFLLACVTQESINRVGLALIAAETQLSTESSACILEVLQENPGAADLGLGRIPDDVDTEAVHLFETGFLAIQCLSDEEAMDTLDQLSVLLGVGDSLRGKDIIALLNPSETACMRERVDSSVLARIQNATIVESMVLAQPMFGCIGPETMGAIYARVSDSK